MTKVMITKKTGAHGELLAWVMTDPTNGYTEAYRTRQLAKLAASRYVQTREVTTALLAPPATKGDSLPATLVNAYRRWLEVRDVVEIDHGIKVSKGKRFMALYKECENHGIPFEKVAKTLGRKKVAF